MVISLSFSLALMNPCLHTKSLWKAFPDVPAHIHFSLHLFLPGRVQGLIWSPVSAVAAKSPILAHTPQFTLRLGTQQSLRSTAQPPAHLAPGPHHPLCAGVGVTRPCGVGSQRLLTEAWLRASHQTLLFSTTTGLRALGRQGRSQARSGSEGVPGPHPRLPGLTSLQEEMYQLRQGWAPQGWRVGGLAGPGWQWKGRSGRRVRVSTHCTSRTEEPPPQLREHWGPRYRCVHTTPQTQDPVRSVAQPASDHPPKESPGQQGRGCHGMGQMEKGTRKSWWKRSPEGVGKDRERETADRRKAGQAEPQEGEETEETFEMKTIQGSHRQWRLPCPPLGAQALRPRAPPHTLGLLPWLGLLLTNLAPVAHVPGSTGPQVAAASGLGPTSRGAVLVPARAAVHQPPDGTQAAGGGALWGRGQ